MIFDIGYNYKIKHIMVFYSADDEYSVYCSHGKYYEVVKGFGADNSSDIGLREFDDNYFEELVHRFDFSSEQKTIKEVCLIDKNERELIRCQTAHCGRGKSHFIFVGLASPIVPYRNLKQTTDGITADCRSLV